MLCVSKLGVGRAARPNWHGTLSGVSGDSVLRADLPCSVLCHQVCSLPSSTVPRLSPPREPPSSPLATMWRAAPRDAAVVAAERSRDHSVRRLGRQCRLASRTGAMGCRLQQSLAPARDASATMPRRVRVRACGASPPPAAARGNRARTRGARWLVGGGRSGAWTWTVHAPGCARGCARAALRTRSRRRPLRSRWRRQGARRTASACTAAARAPASLRATLVSIGCARCRPCLRAHRSLCR